MMLKKTKSFSKRTTPVPTASIAFFMETIHSFTHSPIHLRVMPTCPYKAEVYKEEL